MRKRKQKDLFQVKKNHFGFPNIHSRTNLPDGKVLHIHANLSKIEVTLTEGGLLNDNSLYTAIAWSNANGISIPQCTSGLTQRVKEVNESFLQGKPVFWLPKLHKESYWLCFKI